MTGVSSWIPFHPPLAYQPPTGTLITAITAASDGTVLMAVQVRLPDGQVELRCAAGTCANGVVTFDYEPAAFYRPGMETAWMDISMDDNERVVLVFVQLSELWYVTGTLGADRYVTWNDAMPYGSGDTVSVAISNSGAVLEAHRDPNDASHVLFHLGSWNGAVIDGFDHKAKPASGIQVGSLTSVSAALNASGEVVVGFAGSAYDMPACWAIVGTMQGSEVHWHYLGSREYDEGEFAQVHIDEEGNVVATCVPVGGFTTPYIHYFTGTISSDAKSIDFNDVGIYTMEVEYLDTAMPPGGNFVVALYRTTDLYFLMYGELP
ncbi:MAG TPA: hypothetical protein VEK79_14475 [Thermoanaerobaculia bacterium]|nr:hypothetical protein [Thermoanaerobaculia bacterium]